MLRLNSVPNGMSSSKSSNVISLTAPARMVAPLVAAPAQPDRSRVPSHLLHHPGPDGRAVGLSAATGSAGRSGDTSLLSGAIGIRRISRPGWVRVPTDAGVEVDRSDEEDGRAGDSCVGGATSVAVPMGTPLGDMRRAPGMRPQADSSADRLDGELHAASCP